MKLNACAVFLLLICPLSRVDCSLPVFTPAAATLQEGQEKVSANSESDTVTSLKKHGFMRLPGICQRLKRRRVTIVCNLEKFCWGQSWWRRQKTPPGQVCRCPRGSRCSHFYLHSI
ncbi:hypothetical protein CRENBAI_026615 [Crenichthys baileyi]|uniref:Cocaine- and amphetamine-regulated transcript protein n=1 Tax=Crenichthys baileyi TaxID=28760 RepID=A0AAV9RHD0_9TELE